MKYIDADLLRKEIKRRENNAPLYYHPHACTSVISELEELLTVLDSLQQEHPAKRGYKDCNDCEYNRPLKDQIGWQFRGCFGGDYKGKPIAEIELCPLKLANLQEQQDVDLEKEIDLWISENENIHHGDKLMVWLLKEVARYFYELRKK